jgi:hypothetical protein
MPPVPINRAGLDRRADGHDQGVLACHRIGVRLDRHGTTLRFGQLVVGTGGSHVVVVHQDFAHDGAAAAVPVRHEAAGGVVAIGVGKGRVVAVERIGFPSGPGAQQLAIALEEAADGRVISLAVGDAARVERFERRDDALGGAFGVHEPRGDGSRDLVGGFGLQLPGLHLDGVRHLLHEERHADGKHRSERDAGQQGNLEGQRLDTHAKKRLHGAQLGSTRRPEPLGGNAPLAQSCQV